jgi:hypothetical protein
VRDNALVVSMEFVRCVIMADRIMLPLDNESTEQLDRFLQVGFALVGGSGRWAAAAPLGSAAPCQGGGQGWA